MNYRHLNAARGNELVRLVVYGNWHRWQPSGTMSSRLWLELATA